MLKQIIKHTPILGAMVRRIYGIARLRIRQWTFPGSETYWEGRYSAGGNSGAGSYTLFAEFKAEVINEFIVNHNVQSVIEFGCGDGNQLSLGKYPTYSGYDVSSSAVSRCRDLFQSDTSKSFRLMNEYRGETADLALSLDVVYHLVEDDVFDDYMRTLFQSSSRYVIVYSSNLDENQDQEEPHIRHREFTRWIEDNMENWKLFGHLPNRFPYRRDCRTGSFAEFFIFEKVSKTVC